MAANSASKVRQAVITNNISRILAYRQAVDMRKSFTGLVALVQNAIGEDPLLGSLYLFINRRGNILKGVFWDRTGYCLIAKRLERGRFVLPGTGDTFEVSEKTLRLILDGIVLGTGLN